MPEIQAVAEAVLAADVAPVAQLFRDGAFRGHAFDGVGAEIGDDNFVASAHEAARHVGAHSPQSDHSEIHAALPLRCDAAIA